MKSTHTPEQISRLMRHARVDRTALGEIEERTGLTGWRVIDVTRRELTLSRVRQGRKRVCGRAAKHRRLPELHLKGPVHCE